MARGSNRTKGAPALPGAGRPPTTATIAAGDGLLISHVLPDGTADLGRGRATIAHLGRDRLITILQEDGSEIRIVVIRS